MTQYITTNSGIDFYFNRPTTSMINEEDIAHALCNLCRFTGHTNKFYSVASHSIILANVIRTELRGSNDKYKHQAMLHDASEAYLADISSPLKSLLPEYQELEDNVMSVILRSFGISEICDLVKYYDKQLCLLEGSILLGRKDWYHTCDLQYRNTYSHFINRHIDNPITKTEFLENMPKKKPTSSNIIYVHDPYRNTVTATRV